MNRAGVRPVPMGRLPSTPLAAAAIAVAVYAAWIGFQVGGEHVTAVVDDLGNMAATGLAAAATLWHARAVPEREARLGWLLLGVSALLIELGSGHRAYYELVQGVTPPLGSLGEIPFLGGNAAQVVAILFLCGRGLGGMRPRLLLDGGIVASALLLVSWLTVLRPAYEAGGAPIDLTVALAGPIGDVVVLVIVLSTLAHSRRLDPARLLVVIAVLAIACGDTALAYLSAAGAQLGVHLVDAGWFAGRLLLAVATLVESPPAVEEAPSTARWQVALPYLPLVGASGLVLGEVLARQHLDVLTALVIAAMVAILLGRQLLAVIETQALAVRLKETADRWQAASTEREILIESAPVGICRLSAHGRLLTANHALERILGRRRDELVGRPLDVLIHPDDRRAVAILAALPGPLSGEARFVRSDEAVIWCSYATVAVPGVAGGPDTSISIIEDVNERRLDAERAASIQRQLLPHDSPSMTGYELVGTCVPAQNVAGDFYDWVIADGRVDVTVADVMGKGMGAALVTSAVRTALRAAPAELDPGRRIKLAADTMALGMDGLFVTLFHARLDLRSGLLRYVDAGHGHCAIRLARGDVVRLDVRSMPLGVDADAEFREGEVRLGPGDSLLLYSDGLVETETGTAPPETLRPQLEGAADAGDLLRRLISGTPPHPTDDVTVVVLRRLPEAAPLPIRERPARSAGGRP